MILGDGSGRGRADLVVSPSAAARLVRDGDTVVVGGSGSLLQVPETLLAAVGERFEAMGHPAGLDVVHVMGLGDQNGRGVDHLARAGLVRRFVGSHFVLSPAEQAMIAEDRVEAVGLPAGTISLLYREIAAGRPGLFTDIGLGTYVDPRQQWGRMNKGTRRGLSELVTIGGREWLFYPSFDVRVALIRASTADTSGNLAMEDEAAWSDNLAIAQAAHNTGGIVLAEVKRIVPAGSLPAANVRVPGILVDHVVLTDFPQQTPITVHDPARTGMRVNHPVHVESMTLDHRKVIARRAALELRSGQLVNLGVGMANGISYVALEEDVLDEITLTVEQGLFGGLPGIGLDSGTAVNPAAIIDMTSQFDLYDGGALDLAGLSFAQIDASGNVNVARVGTTPIGPGGFIDISQKASAVVFCGTFRGGGLRTAIRDGRLEILEEGRYAKFVGSVDAITYSAPRAAAAGRTAVYVTERAVFRLRPADLPPTASTLADLPPTGSTLSGLPPTGTGPGPWSRLELIEIAPGIDVERDVLALMPFRPAVSSDLRLMDPRIFRDEPMGLRLPASGSGPRSGGSVRGGGFARGGSFSVGGSGSWGEGAVRGDGALRGGSLPGSGSGPRGEGSVRDGGAARSGSLPVSGSGPRSEGAVRGDGALRGGGLPVSDSGPRGEFAVRGDGAAPGRSLSGSGGVSRGGDPMRRDWAPSDGSLPANESLPHGEGSVRGHDAGRGGSLPGSASCPRGEGSVPGDWASRGEGSVRGDCSAPGGTLPGSDCAQQGESSQRGDGAVRGAGLPGSGSVRRAEGFVRGDSALPGGSLPGSGSVRRGEGFVRGDRALRGGSLPGSGSDPSGEGSVGGEGAARGGSPAASERVPPNGSVPRGAGSVRDEGAVRGGAFR